MSQYEASIPPVYALVKSRPRTAGRILALAAALWLCMLPLRAMVMGYITPDAIEAPQRKQIPELILIGVYDFAFVFSITLAALTVLAIVGRWKPTRVATYAGFALVAGISLIWSLANVRLVSMLGRPFSYQWLYYSDFLKSFDAQQAMRESLDDKLHGVPRAAWYAIGSIATLVGLAWLLGFVGRRIIPRFVSARELAFAIIPLACAYIAFGHWYLSKYQWPRAKLQNPVISFAASAIRAHDAPRLLTMHTDFGADDFLTVAERKRTNPGTVAAAGIRNVVLLVVESLPADQVGAYGSKFPVTPELDKYQDRAAIFSSIYAHAPSTNMSMLSILCSAYPLLSYQSITEEHPDLPLPSLSNELHQRGWRTAFFYGADLSYQKAGEFLASRGFDYLEDGRQRKCDTTYQSKEWSYLSGSDDSCTVESVINWIQQKPNQPFFAMAWTMMTHFPYFPRGETLAYGVKDQYLAKYLNALRCSDESFGKLMRALDEGKLLDSTLVIVVGDHGEAFQQHGTYGHGSAIYEENVHVPLMLINPRLFHGERYDTIGGLDDIAPTVMQMLHQPLPGQWQGRSLWDGDRSGRVYFFAPWSDLLFGYREGKLKLIFNATRNAFEIYDLGKDSGETNNLAGSSGEQVAQAKQRLAAWVQYQAKFYKPLIGNSDAGN